MIKNQTHPPLVHRGQVKILIFECYFKTINSEFSTLYNIPYLTWIWEWELTLKLGNSQFCGEGRSYRNPKFPILWILINFWTWFRNLFWKFVWKFGRSFLKSKRSFNKSECRGPVLSHHTLCALLPQLHSVPTTLYMNLDPIHDPFLCRTLGCTLWLYAQPNLVWKFHNKT